MAASVAEATHNLAGLKIVVMAASTEALSTKVPAAKTSTQVESVSALHRGAAASLLDQSEVHGGFRWQTTIMQV